MQELLTVDQVAAWLLVHRQTVRAWLRRGLFPKIKMQNDLVRIPRQSVADWLARSTSMAVQPRPERHAA